MEIDNFALSSAFLNANDDGLVFYPCPLSLSCLSDPNFGNLEPSRGAIDFQYRYNRTKTNPYRNSTMSNKDPIEHVIVLMLENNSFDHMFGDLPKVRKVDEKSTTNTNTYYGKKYSQTASFDRIVAPEPKHDLKDVLVQTSKDENGDDMGGFVRNYVESYSCPHQLTADKFGQVMDYYPSGSLPALHQLASEFTLCNRWFSSVPGPTWPNRLFAMTGTSLGRVTMPDGIMDLNLHWYDQPTVFDRLDEKGISWKVYFGDIPISSILVHQWEPQNAIRHRPMLEFALDASEKNSDDFPGFVWIEPTYLPPGANDYHPPHDVYDGEDLVRRVYDSIRANENLWNSSLLVVLFDEHGGFYDHVPPPATIAPDHHLDEWSFDRLGVRVPAVLVSPWVENTILSDEFDHTSLLKYLSDKWKLGPLGQRTAHAKSFANAISSSIRTDTPLQLMHPEIKAFQAAPQQGLTDHERSMVSLSHALESMAEEAAEIVAARSRQVLSGAASQVDAAMDRIEGFLRHRAGLNRA